MYDAKVRSLQQNGQIDDSRYEEVLRPWSTEALPGDPEEPSLDEWKALLHWEEKGAEWEKKNSDSRGNSLLIWLSHARNSLTALKELMSQQRFDPADILAPGHHRGTIVRNASGTTKGCALNHAVCKPSFDIVSAFTL